jgi:hypothetical protein
VSPTQTSPAVDPATRPPVVTHVSMRARLAWIGALVAAHELILWLMLARHLDRFFNDAAHRMGPASDFVSYYAAGWRAAHGHSPYGPGPGFGFRYHPLFAQFLGVTLSRLPVPVAYAMWVVIHEVLLVAFALVMHRQIGERRRFGALLLGLLLFSPLYLEIYMGNATFVASTLVLLAIVADRNGRRALAALVFVLSLVVKPIGLVFLPALLVRRRFADATIVGLAAVALAAPFFVQHPGAIRELIDANLGSRDAGWVVHAGNQGLHGGLASLFARLDGLDTTRIASLAELSFAARAALAALPVLLVVVALRATRRLADHPDAVVFLWCAVYLLGFHDVWEHSYSILTLGFGCLAASRLVPDRLLLSCAILLALPTGFVFYDVRSSAFMDPEHSWGATIAVLHHLTKPAGVVILFAACAWKAERIGSAAARASATAIEAHPAARFARSSGASRPRNAA